MLKNVAIVLICLFLASCTKTVIVEKPRGHGPPPHAKAWGHKKKQRVYYYYYPDANVYFDVSFGKYVYLSGGSWVRVSTLPSSIVINSSRVRIDYDGDDVYTYNASHKSKYKSVPPGQAKKMGYQEDGDRGNNGNGNGKGKKKGKH